VALITFVQRQTDVAMQGRVMAALDAAFTLPEVISLAFGAGLVAVLGFRAIYVAEAVGLLAIALYLSSTARGSVDRPVVAQAAAGSIEAS
jgi:hypothetical protein